MELYIYFTILFILGTIFGSFSSVLIERWHSGKGGIMRGRSECPNCKKQLGFFELFPIVSYIFQGGKCAGCSKHISYFYPILEFTMGCIFMLTGYALYKQGFLWETPEFWLMLLYAWITGVYIFYDIKFKEIPDQIIVPGIYLCLILILGGMYNENLMIFFDLHTYYTYHTFFTDHIFGAIILYSFFYFQILIPGGLFLMRKKQFKDLISLLLTYFTLPFTVFIDLFKKKKEEETGLDIPVWIGGGDLRIALFIGLTLGSSHGIAAFSIAYVIGSIAGIGLIILARSGKISRQREIPFGPFLGIGWLITITYHTEILNILSNNF